MRKLLWLCLCCFLGTVYPYEYELSICAIFQNEGEWLKEWIEYHQLVGVEHFYLYNHKSTDQFREVLKPYLEAGIVELKEEHGPNNHDAQMSAYRDCISEKEEETHWLALIDIDEFLVPVKEGSVVEVLKDFEAYPSLVVNWLEFGCAGINTLQPGELLVERATRCRAHDDRRHGYVKHIVQPAQVKEARDPHLYFFHNRAQPVNTQGVPVPSRRSRTVAHDRLCLNHYWGRTLRWMNGLKRARLEAWKWFEKKTPQQKIASATQMINEYQRNANLEENTSIQRFVPELRKRMQEQ